MQIFNCESCYLGQFWKHDVMPVSHLIHPPIIISQVKIMPLVLTTDQSSSSHSSDDGDSVLRQPALCKTLWLLL
ncbi:hypothetical protein SDJN03_08053, partial [Cucurbita argyrosperma subsp. sororia]